CTRATGYRTSPVVVSWSRDVPRADLLRRDIAAGATLLAGADGAAALRLAYAARERRAASTSETIALAGSRWGPVREGPEPTLERAQLFGPDCASATHVVTSVDDGTFRVTSPEGAALDASACQPERCVEPVAIQIQRLRPAVCPPGSLRTGAGC